MTFTNNLRASRLGVGVLLAIVACRHDAVSTSVGATNALTLIRQPNLGSTVTAAKSPPPISGGTLVASKTKHLAVASDPDRDRVYVVDLDALAVTHTIQLAAGVEPGRVDLDELGSAYVVLRNSNQLATVDLATGAVGYRPTCTAPRGVSYDRWEDRVLVTCAIGDLMAFPRTGASNGYWAHVGEDLRDVVVDQAGLHLTGFRKAQVYPVDRASNVEAPIGLDTSVVAWRARSMPTPTPNALGTQQLVVAQDTVSAPVSTDPGGYSNAGIAGTNCVDPIGIVSTRVWMLSSQCDHDGTNDTCLDSVRVPLAVLPVDIATNGDEVVVVSAGNAFSPNLPQIFDIQATDIFGAGIADCVLTEEGYVPGQPTAADFSSADELLVQTREPAQLHVMTTDRRQVFKSITLANDSVVDTGHEIFHANSGGNVACASCHAEGGDDSHVWSFDGVGPRRTPSLRGTIQGTAPYHWNGDQKDIADIVSHVFIERMSGPVLDADQVGALQNYLFALPPPPQLRAPDDASARGQALFGQRCANCHAGDKLTNNLTLDVGTGERFQVPSLVGVGWRGPWLHDGCANVLEDRFQPECGGSEHADLTGLGPAQISDLVAFLQTL